MKFKIVGGGGKGLLTLATITACGIFMVGCGLKNPAKAPFGSTECKGMEQTEVLAELQEAGFTEVTTTEVETVSKSKDGTVESVTIDGTDDYKKDKAWESNVPVEVAEYKLKQYPVEMSVETSGESGEPIFRVHTNLPDGTKLKLTLSGKNYEKEQKIEVQDGVAESKVFRDGAPLQGDYVLTVVMKMADQGWNRIDKEIGLDGECLTGELVRQEEDSDKQYVYLEHPYASDYKRDEITPKISEDEMTAIIENALQKGFGDDYTLEADETGYTIYVWSDGNAMCASLAKAGYAEQKKAWQSIVATTVAASQVIQDGLSENGYGDRVSVINLLNDVDHSYTLCTAAMGMLLFDCVE